MHSHNSFQGQNTWHTLLHPQKNQGPNQFQWAAASCSSSAAVRGAVVKLFSHHENQPQGKLPTDLSLSFQHIHFGRCSENDGLLHVVDLDANSWQPMFQCGNCWMWSPQNSANGAVLCNALWWNADVQGKQYGTNATDSAQCLKTTNVDTMNNNTKPHHKRASPMMVQAPREDTLLTRGIGHPGFCNVEWPNHAARFARSQCQAHLSFVHMKENFMQAIPNNPRTNRTRERLNIWISNRYPLDNHSSTRVYWLPRYSKKTTTSQPFAVWPDTMEAACSKSSIVMLT